MSNGKAEGWDAIADVLEVSAKTAQSYEHRPADQNPLVVKVGAGGLMVADLAYLQNWKVAEADRRTAIRAAKFREREALRKAS